MKTAIELIADERHRQIAQEGWTLEHDDAHDAGELAAAATCYAKMAQLQSLNGGWTYEEMADAASRSWPWNVEDWKPSTHRIRNLEKAGALIAAEIDRLQRAAAPAS